MNAPPECAAKCGKVEKENPARAFTMTLNNFTEKELERINNRGHWPEHLRCVKYRCEHVDQEGKTPHVQAHLFMWEPVRQAYLKKWLRRAHFEKRHGTEEENDAYCSKEGELTVVGDPPAQGFRTDLVGIKRRLDRGETLFQIQNEDEHAFPIIARAERALTKYQNDVQYKRMCLRGRRTPQIFIIYGDSGVAKTKSIYEKHGYMNVYRACDLTAKWFDGYTGQPVVLYDDVKMKGVMDLTSFKKWTTGDPEMVPVKGGFVPFQPEIFYFTSNHAPEMWWDEASPTDWQAFKNRVWLVRRVWRDAETKAVKTELVYKNRLYYSDRQPEAAVDFTETNEEEKALDDGA